LNQPGGLGLKGNLIDNEGFPIDDVSLVLETRDARHKLACLQTDLKTIMKEIEAAMMKGDLWN